MASFIARGTVLFAVFVSVSSENCAPLEYKVNTLISPQFWWFETDAKFCKEAANATTDKCMFMFSLCNDLPVLCPDSNVCQTSTPISPGVRNKLFTWPVRMGSRKYDNFKYDVDDHFFSATYRNGDKTKCKGRVSGPLPLASKVKFQCDKKAVWNASSINSSLPFTGAMAPQPISIEMKECVYTIVFNSSEGCRFYGNDTPEKALSTGSILLILFFPGIFLYCAIGGLINTGKGKSGKEIIPNYSFWSDFPYLVLDGFAFCLSVITCRQMSRTRDGPYQTM
ncbi:predicted protein [Nematostella vectensis]|uniref:Autophagy-related protein 27 n=1 Tax=Nematostella vectensis TaxID=45351 RepID=A7SPR6_NEMVE|nr:uncharacterized protein LOC5505637 [Nematostella vectensis]EDO34314.1 predicted protein [Nematostella vectensis]|eukprot:XP_001626414.1 predicted protein [Nematostella vectensis]